ncbi:MAG: fimbrial protein, partial [Bacteroidetes bacterium QH_6_63_17]
NASAINERRSELRTLEREVEQVDQKALQRRIDSLQAAAAQYAEGNEVMGRLLQGSNKWSDGLATVTGRMNDIQGLSIDQWSSEGETEVTVTGRSTTRSKVVGLAQQLEGEILELTFTETRDVSLYDFQLTVPLDTTKPAAIDYWREQQEQRLAAANDTAQSAAAETTATLEEAPPKAEVEPSASDTSVTAASVASTTEDSNAEGEPTVSGWTVVVASLAKSAAAEEVAQSFRDRLDSDEHPVRVRSAQNGRHRVGVGQFSSLEAARSALRDMNGVLPDEAWLLRISERNSQGSTAETTFPDPSPSARSLSGRSF